MSFFFFFFFLSFPILSFPCPGRSQGRWRLLLASLLLFSRLPILLSLFPLLFYLPSSPPLFFPLISLNLSLPLSLSVSLFPSLSLLNVLFTHISTPSKDRGWSWGGFSMINLALNLFVFLCKGNIFSFQLFLAACSLLFISAFDLTSFLLLFWLSLSFFLSLPPFAWLSYNYYIFSSSCFSLCILFLHFTSFSSALVMSLLVLYSLF